MQSLNDHPRVRKITKGSNIEIIWCYLAHNIYTRSLIAKGSGGIHV